MYKTFLEIKDGVITENYTTSTASKELVDTVYKSIRVFAASKHSNVEVTREKLNTIVNDLLNNKKRAVGFNGKRYDIKDIVYDYIKTHGQMKLDINMELLNEYYENEIKPLIKLGCDDATIATLFERFIILSNFPIYLLMSVLDKEAFKKMQFSVGITISTVLSQIMEQIKEERN